MANNEQNFRGLVKAYAWLSIASGEADAGSYYGIETKKRLENILSLGNSKGFSSERIISEAKIAKAKLSVGLDN